jgi:hypothetical protein
MAVRFVKHRPSGSQFVMPNQNLVGDLPSKYWRNLFLVFDGAQAFQLRSLVFIIVFFCLVPNQTGQGARQDLG